MSSKHAFWFNLKQLVSKLWSFRKRYLVIVNRRTSSFVAITQFIFFSGLKQVKRHSELMRSVRLICMGRWHMHNCMNAYCLVNQQILACEIVQVGKYLNNVCSMWTRSVFVWVTFCDKKGRSGTHRLEQHSGACNISLPKCIKYMAQPQCT